MSLPAAKFWWSAAAMPAPRRYRRWPPRDWDRGRADFGPFDNDGFTAIPVFNWQYGGWGYWFFGVWVPLY